MNKKNIVTVVVVAVLLVAVVALLFFMGGTSKSNLDPVNSAEDLTKLVEKMYEGKTDELLSTLFTLEVDVSNPDVVKSYTGLDNGDEIDFAVASEPMMSSQAYSVVLVKVKDGVNANSVAKKMFDNVDASKWICVTAEKVYVTSSRDVVCLVMSKKEMAEPIYQSFKTLAGSVGQEYERTEQI